MTARLNCGMTSKQPMKRLALALLIALAPVTSRANDAPPEPSPAPLVEPTQLAIVAMQRLYEQNLMLARLFGAMYPDVAAYFDTRAEVIAEVYEMLFGVKIPEVRPGVQS